MATDTRTLGRRQVLLLLGGAAVYPACRGHGATLGCGGDLAGAQGAADASTGAMIDAAGDDATTSTGGDTDGASPDIDAAQPADAASSDSSSGTVDAGDDGPGESDASCPLTASTVTVAFAAYPALHTVNDSVTLKAMGYSDPNCQSDLIIVVHAQNGTYLALSASCTNACCPVKFDGAMLVCPCCKATYDLQGHVLSGGTGMTTVPLPVLATCWDPQAVYVSW